MDIEQLEALALADDRSEALAQLIPGTEDYYFHHCLALQQGQHDDARSEITKLLDAWVKRHGETARPREIKDRQALLDYAQDPAASLEHIRRRLNLSFDHQRETEDAHRALPTRLDPTSISREAFERDALRHHNNLDGFNDRAFEWLAESESLSLTQLRALLSRLSRPDYPKLVAHVLRELKDPHSSGFGSLAVHTLMTFAQLDALAAARPSLLEDRRFIETRLSRLQPAPDIDLDADPELMRAQLDALESFVTPLAAAFNSLKLHVLYHRLDFDRRQGVYDRKRFDQYIRLPRQAAYVAAAYRQRHQHTLATFGHHYESSTGLAAVSDDTPLVRDYLAQIFADPTLDHYDAYRPYLDSEFLRRVFAETRILAGIGDQERWYSMLDDPTYYGALERRVDIEIGPDNPRFVGANQPVELHAWVKNVPALVVKVFEINTLAYFQAHGRAVDTSVDLDGLVANDERVFEYQEPALRRVARTLSFPSLTRPGTYVIELIGGGKSSRALLCKGGLRYVERLGAAGHVLTILDEDNQLVPEASVWFGGREYQADKHGDVRLPYGAGGSATKLLLRHGRATTITNFNPRAERYAFKAGIHVEREQLIAGQLADVVVRATLTLNGVPVSPTLIQTPTLTINSSDRHGTHSSVSVALELGNAAEAVHTFKVPEALHQLSFKLTAKVRSVTEQRELELSDHSAITINEIDLGGEVVGLHLAATSGGHVLYALGKSGEPRPDLQVNVSVAHVDFRARMQVALQTDARGRVELGALARVDDLQATLGAKGSARWTLPRASSAIARAYQVAHGDELVLPRPPDLDQPVLSLLERRGSGYLRDRIDAVSIQDQSIHVRGLESGDYELVLAPDHRRVQLRVGGETVARGWALSPKRHLQLRTPEPLHVASIEAVGQSGEQLRVCVAGADDHTRVHVFASRFVAPGSADGALNRLSLPQPNIAQVGRSRCLYLSGRDIGDEYRYILERSRAEVFAGNMLERPGLLLNPWALRSTSTGTQAAKAGERYESKSSDAYAASSGGAPTPEPSQIALAPSNNLDFLAAPAYVALNLAPDDDGVVVIDRSALAGHHLVQVVAVNTTGLASRYLKLPETEPAPRDLRLLDALAPTKHFVKRKQRSSLGVGEQLVLEDIRTAKIELVDSVAKAHALLLTLSNDAHLREFEFVTRWPSLTPEQQREKYSKYACHELNLFLSRKDPLFFAELVAPYLVNKRDKTFLDHYLLGEDLRAYLEPWAYGRLNTLERLLLAGRVEGERASGSRHIKDRFDLLAPDIEGDNALFDTALQGSALETTDTFGFGAMQAEAIGGGGPPPGADTAGYGGVMLADTPSMAPPARSAAPAPAAPPAARRPPPPPPKQEKAKRSRKREASRGGRRDKETLDADLLAREQVRRLYRVVDKTKEWAENNYYQRRIAEQGPELIVVNAFWRDFAEHLANTHDAPFLSGQLVRATSNFAEMMCALALLDLPFEAAAPATELEGTRMTLRANTALISFHEQIAEITDDDIGDGVDRQLGLLVSQNYFRADDRYHYENNERHDKYVEGELLVHTVYQCQVVLTNPSSAPHKLELLLQIPRGAMPVSNGFATQDLHVHLPAYGTQSIDYAFYFPSPGSYSHFPVHVAKHGQLAVFAAPTTLEVVTTLSSVDTGSWSHVSQHADTPTLLRYLNDNNLERLDLRRVAWRMRERGVFEAVLATLTQRHVYAELLWSYAIHHADVQAIGEYLRHQDGFLRGCGLAIDSPLVRTEPVSRRWMQHLEYAPLINARAHQLGAQRQILNTALAAQYQAFLQALSYQPKPDDDQLVSAAYYALLQDRVSQGLALLDRVDPERVTGQLQWDYLVAYAALHRYCGDHGDHGDDRDHLARARALAERHSAHGVDRWRKRFTNLLAMLDEAQGAAAQIVDADNREQAQAQLAASEASFDFGIEGNTITLTYQNLASCTLSCYRMDIELLFSRQPFMKDQSQRFSIVQPNYSEQLTLPPDQSEHRVELPAEFRSSNTIIELVGAGLRRSQANYAHELSVRMIEQFGQLRVLERATGKSLARAYVKVYARKQGGAVEFYKDGYTDLRGAFDYASLSTDELDRVEQFAVLVKTERRGALIREAAPPRR